MVITHNPNSFSVLVFFLFDPGSRLVSPIIFFFSLSHSHTHTHTLLTFDRVPSFFFNMSERSISPPIDHSHRRSLSPRSPPSRRGRSYSRSRSSSSRSYSRSRSRSRSYSRCRRSPSRSRSPYRRSDSRSYHRRYYSRSPPPHSHRRRTPPPPSRRYRSRSPPLPPPRRRIVNKDCRVYVGNLHFEVTWHQLKDFMREGIFSTYFIRKHSIH